MSYFVRLTVLAACAAAPAFAQAQHFEDTFIGFQTDCNGNPTPGTFSSLPAIPPGYKEMDSGLYAPCGLQSVTSDGNLSQKPQLFKPVFTTPAGGRMRYQVWHVRPLRICDGVVTVA